MSKKEKYTTKVVLLDTHAILHRAYHALPDFTSSEGEPTGALYGLVTMILKIIDTFKPDHIVACYDLPEPTYRHTAYSDYKGTRSKTDDLLAVQIDRSRDVLSAFGIPVYESSGFEADDILGTIAFQLKKHDDTKVIIASGDMDTMQCIDGDRVVVFTLKKGIKDTILYDKKAIIERFGFEPDLIPDYKGLRGDSSDNIPGIRGIGEKTATTLITNIGSLDDIFKIVKEDAEKLKTIGLSPRIISLLREYEEDAYFSKMLATIRVDAPIVYEKTPKTWRESIDLSEVDCICNKLSFRAIPERVRFLLDDGNIASKKESYTGENTEEVKEALLGLWLINSDITNPDYKDLISFTRSKGVDSDFYAVKTLLDETLKTHNLWELYNEVELPLQKVISHMHQFGIRLDKKQFSCLGLSLHKELDELSMAIFGEAGCEFNINSPKQLGEVLYDALGLKPKNAKKTAGGQRSTRESELEKMIDDHPIVELVLKYRELHKLVSTYVDPLPKMVSLDGRLRPTFLQTGTTTGRLSCKDPNLQNIPTRTKESKKIRRGFVSESGYKLVSIDYSQIELRVASVLSGDKKLIDIFKNGEDIHTGVAVRVFNVTADEVTDEMRRKAKVINFGILYGMGVNALKSNLGKSTSRAEAQSFLNAYFQTFTRLAEYLEEIRDFARNKGYTKTLYGRRRHFPAIKSRIPHLRAQAERMAINAPIQGTAADIIRVAMNNVYKNVVCKNGEENIRILVQVHDELLLEVKETLLDQLISEVVSEMESVFSKKQDKGVPLVVDVAVGSNWADLKDYSLDV